MKLLEFGKFALTVKGWGSGMGEATGELSHKSPVTCRQERLLVVIIGNSLFCASGEEHE